MGVHGTDYGNDREENEVGQKFDRVDRVGKVTFHITMEII